MAIKISGNTIIDDSRNLVNINALNNIVYPSVDGSNNQVLTTNGNGELYFSTIQESSYLAGTGLNLSGSTFSIDNTVATLSGSQTLSNKTLSGAIMTGNLALDEVTEKVHQITGTVIAPANGTVQWGAIINNITFTASFTSGQSVLLQLSGGASYTVTWPATRWIGGSVPTLASFDAGSVDVLVLWQRGADLYGKYLGVT